MIVARTRTYVKHVEIMPDNHSAIDSLLDALILKETDTGATFKDITSCMDEAGAVLFTIAFERISS